MSDSYIKIDKASNVQSFVGPDSVYLYSAIVIRTSIKLWMKAKIKPTRNMSITQILKRASTITGKNYKRTEQEKAIADLTVFIETLKSALPIIEE